MKHFFLFGLLAILPVWGLFSVELRVGAVASMNDVAIEAVVEGPIDWLGQGFRPELGLEVGTTRVRPQVLVPIGVMWEDYGDRGLSWGAAVHVLPGVSTGSSPALLWGAEGELRTEWSWSPGISLGISAGVRYTDATWEIPIHVLIELGLGTDTLEPEGAKERE